MEKRGQAAMEFLMTYGWAILAAIIAIAVLAYFGVFSPERYVPETCVLAAPIGCEDDSTASAANGVTIQITNGAGEQIHVQEIDVDGCGTTTDFSDADGEQDADIEAGATQDLDITCDTALTEGDQFRGNIDITYTRGSGTRVLTSTGSISRTVIA